MSASKTDAPEKWMWQNRPISLLVLGMAGSGKTTFVQRLASHLSTKKQLPYLINLDPAVKEVPYPANIGKSYTYIKICYITHTIAIAKDKQIYTHI